MKKFTLSATLLLMVAVQSFAQFNDRLYIVNPEWGNWWNEPAQIDEAEFLVEPKGLYTEVQMFLTFSSPWGDVGTDSLEIVMDFKLPKGSIVHDSWLWVYDLPVQADMLDLWTAIETYEDIVDRRTDPSILFEVNEGYQLRIYPLTAAEKRKVKLTMLIPTEWTDDYVYSSLPSHLLTLSDSPLDYKIYVKESPEWQNPQLDNLGNNSFTATNHPEFGDVLVADISANNIQDEQRIIFDAPYTDGVYLSTYEGQSNYYQLAYQPPIPMDTTIVDTEPKKIVFCLDFDEDNTEGNSELSLENLWENLKIVASEHLNEDDSINIIYRGQMGIAQLTYFDWQPFSVENMGDLPDIQQVTEVGTMLLNAHNFIESVTGEAEIYLITNSDEYNIVGHADVALDSTLNDIIDTHKISVFDFQNTNTSVSNFGNSYFNEELTERSGGYFYSYFLTGNEGTAYGAFKELFTQLPYIPANQLGFSELYTTLENGICFSRYGVDYHSNEGSIYDPQLQVGQFIGEPPFEIEYTTVVNGEFDTQNLTIAASQIISGDTLLEEMWVYHRIQELEATASNNQDIQNIIDISLDHRVLSKYTAFLAIEPTLTADEGCFDCYDFDDQILINTDEKQKETLFSMTAFPNPFANHVLINMTISSETDLSNLQVIIYDQLGREVAMPIFVQRLSDTQLQLSWDGKSQAGQNLPSGTYYLIAVSDQGTGKVKLIKG